MLRGCRMASKPIRTMSLSNQFLKGYNNLLFVDG